MNEDRGAVAVTALAAGFALGQLGHQGIVGIAATVAIIAAFLYTFLRTR